MKYQIINGNNIDVLKTFPDNHFDSIVTDPPYGIDFLGKAWDANTGALETYQECLRVLKPGGHILAFSAARTYHHLAITLEQAGFEIRDQIMWIYSSGFPKSQDVGRTIQRSNKNEEPNEWLGWGTALKPAHEPICLARKPIKVGSVAKNVQIHGTGALNIDATRVPYADEQDKEFIINTSKTFEQTGTKWTTTFDTKDEKPDSYEVNEQGRFPSNVIGEIEEPYQKYFYCPKVSRRERHTGFDPNSQGVIIDSEVFGKTPVCLDCGKTRNGSTKHDDCDPANIGFQERRTKRSDEVGNNHPTVKPVELMKYLIKLVTPPGGIVLDPFNGSGSTGMAAVELGHEYVGIELDANYVEIAKKRIEAWNQDDSTFKELFE